MKTKSIFMKTGILVFVSILFGSCSSIPKGALAVKPFDSQKYLGRWYEIARFDFRFERDLDNTTADYTINADGSIKVDNRGYNYVTREWKQAIGKAKLVKDASEARLKVSFFGPFFSGYNVIALDAEYRYALVAGNSLRYLWILSRETSIPEDVKQNYLSIAKDLGYDISALIWVKHNK